MIMKTKILPILALSLLSAPVFAADSCEEANRNTVLCFKMKHLRSQVSVLDSQRDLLQTNFPLVDCIAKDMDSLVTSVLVSGYYDDHLRALSEVKSAAISIRKLAKSSSIEAFTLSNTLKSRCLACHASSSPSSGHTWESISHGSWDGVVSRCNEAGRNPYLCKQLAALMTTLNYFRSSEISGIRSFEGTEAIARESARLAAILKPFESTYPGEPSFSEIERKSIEIMTLAKERKTQAYEQGRELIQACTRCKDPEHR